MNINDESSVDSFLKAIEEMWGYHLPKGYRDFLLKKNGGIPENPIFSFKDESDGSCISEFFGIKKGFNTNLLLKQRYAGDRVPENFLPIASDVYGNMVILAVKNADRGKIYFWDHELEADEGETPDYSNLTLVADNFESFIEGLRPEEDL